MALGCSIGEQRANMLVILPADRPRALKEKGPADATLGARIEGAPREGRRIELQGQAPKFSRKVKSDQLAQGLTPGE